MKEILKNTLMIILASSIVYSCTEDADSPSLEGTATYVQFDDNTVGDAENGIIETNEPATGTSVVTLTVENPFGVITEDISVSYTLGGDAVFGTDYTITDADASGGSFVIINRQDTLDNGNPSSARDSFDLEVNLLSDGVQDGDKNLIVTLSSANTSDDIPINASRSGLPERSELTISIADVD